MKPLIGIALALFAFFKLPAVGEAEPEAPPKLTKTSDATAPTLHKWKFEQATSAELLAVVRVEHFIMGTIVESFDEVTFCPEDADIGSLTVELDSKLPRVPKVTFPAMNNYLRFRIDPDWSTVTEALREIECADGKRRNAREVEIVGEHEVIRVTFFAAPPELYRDKEPKIKFVQTPETASITQRYATVVASDFIISGPNQEESAERVSVRPRPKNP
jgi:hypothetical protein